MVAESKESRDLVRQATTAVRRIHSKVVRKATRKLEAAASRAMEIDDDGRAVEEPKRADHVAMDLRKSKRNAPYYIDVLMARQAHVEKIAALSEQAAPTQLNIGVVNVVVAREYPVINIDPKE